MSEKKTPKKRRFIATTGVEKGNQRWEVGEPVPDDVVKEHPWLEKQGWVIREAAK